jgi:DNA ligase-1
MLAEAAKSPEEALEGLGGEALADVKIDGIRAQIHCTNGRISVFSRALADLTDRLGAAVRECLGVLEHDVVLDGEIALVDAAGRPFAFQDTMSALGESWVGGPGQRLRLFAFDVLALGGESLVDRPLVDRRRALVSVVGEGARAASRTVRSPEEARRAYDDALAEGHEGLVLKRLDAPYVAGARDAAWFKVKKVETADLVVLAAEWGSGRRRGTLSNVHLGARAECDDGFVMVGKTFKGMTDAMLAYQTERLLALETSREGGPDHGVVRVRPGLCAEVAYSDVQRSPRYPGGVSLRLARIVRYRDDKSPSEATTIEELRRGLPRVPEVTPRRKTRETTPTTQLSLFAPRGSEPTE